MKEQERDELLIRMDERTKKTADEVQDIKKNYTTKAEFAPIRSVVYGMCGTILIAILTAIVASVVNKT